MTSPVHVVGGGLAGSEAAWQLASRGVPVVLHEMRPVRATDAHATSDLAELVCSNSLRSDDAETNAVGLLHAELRRAGSIVMRAADANQVPAGSALAVDRNGFAAEVTRALGAHPLVEIRREEVAGLPPAGWDSVILATGPLTSPDLAAAIGGLTGQDSLAFFDAIAPIVHRDSIDFDIAWMQSRWDKAGPSGDRAAYVNCPLEKDEYRAFVAALLDGEKTEFREWERDTPYFEGCLPIEVMASRGPDTLRFGPMKPVGLVDPRSGRRPYAVVQLRQDNALGTLYDIALDATLRLRTQPRLRFAGQVTGVEGYVESAAMGLLAGIFAAAARAARAPSPPPATTAFGALLGHVTGGADSASFQPMNCNFGLFPPLPEDADVDAKGRPRVRGTDRRKLLTSRALRDVEAWLAANA